MTGSGLPPRWLVLSLAAPPAGEEILLVDALRRLGARSVEQRGERFIAHFPPPASLESLSSDVRAAVGASTSLRPPELSWAWEGSASLAERWSAEFEPRRVSPRLTVASAAGVAEASPTDVVIRLHAGAAFGTASHPTTRSCLRILDRLHQPGDRVADIGAGSGILAIAAALLGSPDVVAIESDPLACASARANLSLNEVEDRVTVLEMDAGPGDVEELGSFSVVFANIGASGLIPLLPGLRAALEPRGRLVVSGVVGGEARDVVTRAGMEGLELAGAEFEDAWWTGVFRPRGSTRVDSPAATNWPLPPARRRRTR
jgi:ribosomal protein L11 methyltransferase